MHATNNSIKNVTLVTAAFILICLALIPRPAYAINKCYPSGSSTNANLGLTLNVNAPPASLNSASFIIGTTPSQIKARFASVIEDNFRTGNVNRILGNLSPTELRNLAALYRSDTAGNTAPLLAILAKSASAKALVRIAGVFGRDPTIEAVDLYAPTAVATRFFASPSLSKLQSPSLMNQTTQTGGSTPFLRVGGGGPAPTPDMTLSEIYLDFRTAPVGSMSVSSALFETATYAGTELVTAWTAGYTIGTAVNNVITTYDPSLENTIGGTISQMLSDINSSISAIQQGQYENSWDSLFGGSQPAVPQNSGNDFNVTSSLATYMSFVAQNGGAGNTGGGNGCP